MTFDEGALQAVPHLVVLTLAVVHPGVDILRTRQLFGQYEGESLFDVIRNLLSILSMSVAHPKEMLERSLVHVRR